MCIQNSRAVKHAKDDIERLQRAANSVTDLLRSVKRLLQRPDNTQPSTSHRLHVALKDCFRQLVQINTTLDIRKRRKTEDGIELQALKQPFERSSKMHRVCSGQNMKVDFQRQWRRLVRTVEHNKVNVIENVLYVPQHNAYGQSTNNTQTHQTVEQQNLYDLYTVSIYCAVGYTRLQNHLVLYVIIPFASRIAS